jgi:hypothetical protein
VFHHHDGIGAIGYWRAGHDLDGFAVAEDAGESAAGAHLADKLEDAGSIGSTHSEAIADGTGDSGGIAVGANIFGKDAASGGKQIHVFYARGLPRGAHSIDDKGTSFGEC